MISSNLEPVAGRRRCFMTPIRVMSSAARDDRDALLSIEEMNELVTDRYRSVAPRELTALID